MKDWIDNIESAWKGHRGFAEWLVRDLGVRTAVELGVDRGYSLFCLANAGIDKIYGVDLWEPGSYGYGNHLPRLEELAESHGLTKHIEFIRGDFGEVAKQWNNGQVDLLHIDGTHTYEAVKSDFTNWEKYVHDDGVILMHDICVPSFTVKPFFNELTHPKAWFEHSAGLGVVCKNKQVLDRIVKAFPNLRIGNVA